MLFLGILLEGNSGVQARGGLDTTRGRLLKKEGKNCAIYNFLHKLNHEIFDEFLQKLLIRAAQNCENLVDLAKC